MSRFLDDALLFDQDISGWDIDGVSNATSILLDTSFSTANYDTWLQTTAANINDYTDTSVTWDFPSQYSAARQADRDIITTYGWTLNDGGSV